MNKIILIYLALLSLSCNGSKRIQFVVTNGDTVILTYSEKNTLISESFVKNGNLNGLSTEFTDRGKVKRKGNFLDGLKTGVWLEYTETGKPIAASYYFNDSVIYGDIDPNDYDLHKYTFKDRKLKINLPVHWIKDENRKGVLISSNKSCEDHKTFCPNINIVSYELTGDFNASVTNNLKQMSQLTDFKIIVSKGITINKSSVLQFTYIYTYNNVKLAGMTSFFLNDRIVYVITCSALNEPEGSFMRYKDLFEMITKSFEF